MAHVVSVNVGLPRDVPWNGRTVRTGAWKDPVAGPRLVRRHGIDGDGQGDTHGHGGPHRAVLVYQVAAYDYWRRHLGRPDLGPGSFAENLTVEGLADAEVCIGDRFRIGDAEFEVSQPRVTCYRAGLRIGRPDLAALLVAHRRPGFYLRVIREGSIRAGDEITRTATGAGRVTVSEVDALLYLPGPDLATARRAAAEPALSPGWRASLREILAGAGQPPGHAAATPAWDGFRALTVVDVVAESPGVTSFRLSAPDGGALPRPEPGQYLTIRPPELRPPQIRSYSLSGATGSAAYRISVKRQAGGQVSDFLHRHLRPGAQLDVAAPRGRFVLGADPARGPVVFASAGIGITPLLAMLHEVAEHDRDREVWWLHTAPDADRLAFGAETRALLGRLGNAHAYTFLSRPPASGREELPAVVPGRAVHRRLSAAAVAGLRIPAHSTAYLCGPPGFMTDLTGALTAAGLDRAGIHTEAFGTLAAVNPGLVPASPTRPKLPAGPPGSGPRVAFARSGLTAPFDLSRSSLLEFAEACDVPTRWQCRTGVCRTCETGLLDGQITYDPPPLDTPTPGTVLPCCARPHTDVVLDM